MPRPPMTAQAKQERESLVRALHAPDKPTAQIAKELSNEVGYPCSEWMTWKIISRLGLERGAPAHLRRGEDSPSWNGGRAINKAGYAYVPAPPGHPHARRAGNVLEHRLIVEQHIGRYLRPEEVVDHIDRLTLHNHPTNLRLFASSADHLVNNLSGAAPIRSVRGELNGRGGRRRLEGRSRVDTARLRTERGDSRLRQCILIVLKFGPDHPFALGTTHWLEQSGIDPQSRPSLERAWDDLVRRYAADLAQ